MSAARELAGLVADVRRAQVARAAYRDRTAAQPLRDAAVIEYSRAQDAIFARLDRMMETGVLATLSRRLEKRGWW